jgi:hypothetical protein
LTALPANQPGGTNYAISGAMSAATPANGNIGNLNQNTTLPSTVQQMANYLASHDGAANSQALYASNVAPAMVIAIGTVPVACLPARLAGVPQATMASTGRRTSSAARA